METIGIAIALETAEARNALRDAARTRGLEVVLDQPAGADSRIFVERIGELRPQIVIIESTRLWGPVVQVVESLRNGPGATPAVVMISPVQDPETIMGAMRAGVAEFIYPPFDLNTGRSLDHLLEAREATRRAVAGKTFGFLSVKGGCGATTIACQIAAELQRSSGKTVLLADFDPDLGIIAFLLKTKSQYSLTDALQQSDRLDRSLWEAFVSTAPSGISVLNAPEEPGPITLESKQSADLFRFVRAHYDLTLIDLGRGVTRINFAAMTDIDCTCLVTSMDIPSLHRARKMIRTLLNGGCAAERLRLIVNHMPRHHDVSIPELEKMLGFPVYGTVPEDTAAISDSYTQNGLVAPGTPLGRQAALLAAKLTGQPMKEPRRLSRFVRA